MKLRLICIIMAAVLLAGCGGAPESSDMSEKPEHTTTAAVTTTTATTAASTTASQESPLNTEQTSQGSPVGGVSLSSEHEELRSVFKGADGYCDFEDMGLQFMHCTDIEKKALAVLAEQDGFDNAYEGCRLKTIAADDGCFYFTMMITYSPDYELYGGTWIKYYFCCDCDTGEVTQMILPEGYTELAGISGDVMVVGNDGQYIIVHRESGFVQPLPDKTCNVVVCDNVVFFQYPFLDEGESVWRFTTGWYTVDENHAFEGSTDVYDQRAIIFDDMEGSYYCERFLRRGVDRILGYSSRYNDITTLTGTSFLTNDSRRRVRDMIYNTYYAGTVMLEKNLLGYRSRFSIIDDNGEDHVLGTMQTDNDHTYSSDFYATKDGVIYLNTVHDTFIMLGEEKSNGRIDCTKDIVVAFAPDQLDRSFDNVFCDDECLYFFNVYTLELYALRRAE